MSESTAVSQSSRPAILPVARISLWQQVSFTLARVWATTMVTILGFRGLYRFGRIFGTIEWLINFKRRRRYKRAYRHIFSEHFSRQACRKSTREFFCRSRCDKLFYLIIDTVRPDQARSLFSITNRADLDAALAKGCGVYLAMSHHGPHHVAAMLLTLNDYRIALVRDRREGGIRKYVQDRFDQARSSIHPMRVIFADSYPRDIYRCLKDGYVLGSAMDVGRVRTANQKTEEVEIFGETRSFLSGPLRMALRCQATVFQAFVVPEKNFHYRFELVAMLVNSEETLEEDAIVARTMNAYAANVEAYLRKMPSLLSKI